MPPSGVKQSEITKYRPNRIQHDLGKVQILWEISSAIIQAEIQDVPEIVVQIQSELQIMAFSILRDRSYKK